MSYDRACEIASDLGYVRDVWEWRTPAGKWFAFENDSVNVYGTFGSHSIADMTEKEWRELLKEEL